MKYCQLGRSGLTVSRICLGTLNFGPETPEPDSYAHHGPCPRSRVELLRHLQRLRVEAGGGLDRADHRPLVLAQGADVASGLSWRPRSTNRPATGPTTGRLSARHIRRACDASLRGCRPTMSTSTRCTTSTGTPWDEIWEAMDVLRTQGKILYVGSSNFAGWHLAQAQEAALARSSPAWSASSPSTTCVTRDIEREVIPAAEAYGIGGTRLVTAASRHARPGSWQPGRRDPVQGRPPRQASRPAGALRGAVQERACRRLRSRWPGCCRDRARPVP